MESRMAREGVRSTGDRRRDRSRGQMLALFVVTLLVLLGMAALVIDISWYWLNNVRMQRAADAAALAGVVYLPGNAAFAYNRAHEEAVKNGYTGGVNGIAITPAQNPANPRRLDVTVEGPVPTYFMRVFGIESIPARRQGNAEYVLPVPMGSPEAYYGVFGTLRSPGGGTTTITPGVTAWRPASADFGGSSWSSPGNVYVDDGTRATVSTANAAWAWGTFSILNGGPLPTGVDITGIQVRLNASRAAGTVSGCRFAVFLSWNAGSSWTSATRRTPDLTNSNSTTGQTDTDHDLGSSSDLWGRTSWVRSELSNANFRVRVQYINPSTCGVTGRLDLLAVRVHYQTSLFEADTEVTSPYDGPLVGRGFWGTMLSQGAEDVNGDAYLPNYETRTSVQNPDYRPALYYNYAVQMPQGSSGGEVWLFDPVFCATGAQYGTGDRWFGGNRGAMSAFYDLYDTRNTPYDESDDNLVATSGNLFRRSLGSDESLSGPTGYTGYVSCEDDDVSAPTSAQLAATPQGGNQLYYHNRWWRMATNLPGGTTYRLRTSTTDPNSATDQLGSNGHNNFSIWARANGGAPRVHGIGAMQNYSPLLGGQSSTFYLAQVDAVHRGKTMVINLWDPGDTGTLEANLQILRPASGGYQTATFNWRSELGTTNATASNCGNLSGTNATSVTTNTGGSGSTQVFNGCWLTMEIPLPIDYAAPTPPGETEPGWWKIRYNMVGSAGANSFDITTWQVSIRGNPVHLVLP
jgi:hypothetical protein